MNKNIKINTLNTLLFVRRTSSFQVGIKFNFNNKIEFKTQSASLKLTNENGEYKEAFESRKDSFD